jgi:hypothetical protein
MNTKIKTIIIGLVAAGGFATASGLAVPAISQAEIVQLQNNASGKCLQPASGSGLQGTPIVQETCNGSLAQQWTKGSSKASHGSDKKGEHYQNRSSQLCLDALGKAEEGTPIAQWTCNGITNENWMFGNGNTASHDLLASRISGADPGTFCITAPGTPSGVTMQLSACDNNEASEYFSLGTARLAPPIVTLPVVPPIVTSPVTPPVVVNPAEVAIVGSLVG